MVYKTLHTENLPSRHTTSLQWCNNVDTTSNVISRLKYRYVPFRKKIEQQEDITNHKTVMSEEIEHPFDIYDLIMSSVMLNSCVIVGKYMAVDKLF
jgi:transcription initiation factor TFIID subunit TAF12